MGYYSRFTITPNIPNLTFVEEDAFGEAFKQVTGYEGEWYGKEYIVDGKWYDANANMVTLSKKFPEVTFEFERIGEEAGEGEKYSIKDGVVIAKYKRGWVLDE